MINSIETRYDKENRSALCGYFHSSRITSCDSFEQIKCAADYFSGDVNFSALDLEIKFIRSSKLVKDILAKAVEEERKPSLIDLYCALLQKHECFPNLSRIIKIALTIALTSAERSFTMLNIIKNRLRSTMTQDRLDSLMLMSVESDICQKLDIGELVKRFSDAAPRKWNLY
jgi:hypothetical protein